MKVQQAVSALLIPLGLCGPVFSPGGEVSPAPPPGKFCTSSEWETVSTLEGNGHYLHCQVSHDCLKDYGYLNRTCVSDCLQSVGISPTCSDCVVHFCLDPVCPHCFDGQIPTPAPTAEIPCSSSDWAIIENLGHNDAYLECGQQNRCWSYIDFQTHKECLAKCMRQVGCSGGCAECVVHTCYGEGPCDACHGGPAPTPTPGPTSAPCSTLEWEIVTDLANDFIYEKCTQRNHCWISYGALNKTCMSMCIQLAGCSAFCADCVVNNCGSNECPTCQGQPTPVPTPASPPCSDSDWQVVVDLSSNGKYRECEETNHCWNGYGDFNKTCMASCMAEVGCSMACAQCVVQLCTSSDCPVCHIASPTPLPTSSSDLCNADEWAIVSSLSQNSKYLMCDEQNHCWKGFGDLDKDCVAFCISTVGCSLKCANCVVDDCFDGDCTKCHGGSTPAPTPHPPGTHCSQTEWFTWTHLEYEPEFLACDENKLCWDQFGGWNITCVKLCLQKVGISIQCADCVVEHCVTADCPACYNGPTPAPTPTPPPVSDACSHSDWGIVENLHENEAYLLCEEVNHCWNGFGDFDKNCLSQCMQRVRVSATCTACVVYHCVSHDYCPQCYSGPSPTPSPAPTATPCSEAEWAIVVDLRTNEEYFDCGVRDQCWNFFDFELHKDCLKKCMQEVGCHLTCATCMVDNCLYQEGSCPPCQPPSTPSPTPYIVPPCSAVDWEIVRNLENSEVYVKCEIDNNCWPGFSADLNKTCIARCMEKAGCSIDCGTCVVEHCHTTDCPTCHVPVTPSPTPVPGTMCTASEWETVSKLDDNEDYIHCQLANQCLKDHGYLNRTCLSKCLQSVGCSALCSDCVVHFCLDLDCPHCFQGQVPTPAPTSEVPCSGADWVIVQNLGTNQAYLNCGQQNRCWSYIDFQTHKECLAKCMRQVGCSNVCAECVVHTCYGDGPCDACHGDITPAPTPTPGPSSKPCTASEWEIASDLVDNFIFQSCSEHNGCWSSGWGVNKTCLILCVEMTGCSAVCADCVVENCISTDCHVCHDDTTPAPTPAAAPCSDEDWEVVTNLEHNDLYHQCEDVHHCWIGYNDFNKTCMISCIEQVGCSANCAKCVVEFCTTTDCPVCHKGLNPTPAPSPQGHCTQDEWNTWTHLENEPEFLACDENKLCWDQFGGWNITCVKLCLQQVGVSAGCADCVIEHCVTADCPTCYHGVTPAPTPIPPHSDECTQTDWGIVENLHENPGYLQCEEINHCWNGFGWMNETCSSQCMQRVGLPAKCSNCVAHLCRSHTYCPQCYTGPEPPTPSPAPTATPCSDAEWEIVEGLHTNTQFMDCGRREACWNIFDFEVHKRCVAKCMREVGCLPACANCMVNNCLYTEGSCPQCQPPSTPSPTPYTEPPCTGVDWEVVIALEDNEVYLQCEIENECWPGFSADLNKTCIARCMEKAGCSIDCATCVVEHCHTTNCPTCYVSRTPSPTPEPGSLCTKSEWEKVATLEDDENYIYCQFFNDCFKNYGHLNRTCVSECLQSVGLSATCSNCVVHFCLDLDCPHCYNGVIPTPSPTATDKPCTDSDWVIVEGLVTNQAYLDCGQQNRCWTYVDFQIHKECLAKCMRQVGCSNVCAECVVHTCYGDGPCDACHTDGRTPAPTPTPGPSTSPCTSIEWEIVTHLQGNYIWETCVNDHHQCWDEYGALNQTCMTMCLEMAGCAEVCAVCVVQNCQHEHCPMCHDPVTPAPTPASPPCTSSDWDIVTNANSDPTFLKCEQVFHCWTGYDDFDLECMSGCFQMAGVSAGCATCTVHLCESLNCPACFASSTPAPTPTPAPGALCKESEWEKVAKLEDDENYIYCQFYNDCLKNYGHLNRTCVSECLQSVGLSATCADCVVHFCYDLDCPHCYGGVIPTPAPTATDKPCSNTDWDIVDNLPTNTAYLHCGDKCYNHMDFELHKQCVAKCMEEVGCSVRCAQCVVNSCYGAGPCDVCHSNGHTPAPTPTPGPSTTPCTAIEWEIVTHLEGNYIWETCVGDHQMCWDEFGALNRTCMAMCLEMAGCAEVCANCVVDNCHHGHCPICYSDATPAPTPATPPCTNSDWAVVSKLDSEPIYLQCEQIFGCWNGYADFDKHCMAKCMEVVGCSVGCASCVVDFCESMNCPVCHAGSMPSS